MSSELPAAWRAGTWGELVELRYGKALPANARDGGSVVVYGTNGPTGTLTAGAHGAGPGIVVGRKGAYRGVTWAPGPFWVIDTAFYVLPRPDVELDMDWAFWALSAHDINGLDSGSAIPSTRREDVYDLPVRVPPLDEQRRVGGVLRLLQRKAASNEREARILVAIAEALYGDAARRVAGRRPLGSVASHHKETVKPAERPDERFEHFSIPAFDDSSLSELAEGRSLLSAKHTLPPQAVAVSKLNPRTKRVLWPSPTTAAPAICSSEFVVLRPRALYSPELLYAALRFDRRWYGELLRGLTGTTGSRQRVKPADALDATVPDFAPGEAERLTAALRPLVALAGRLHVESARLRTAGADLLPKLVRGDIRLPAAPATADAHGSSRHAASSRRRSGGS